MLIEHNTKALSLVEHGQVFATLVDAEQALTSEGFAQHPTKRHQRWSWTYGLVDADIRRTSEGFVVTFRA
jgi:hypothetical protein